MFCGQGPEKDASSEILNQMQFMDELYRKVTLQGSSVAEISSLNSRRFILEELALELISAGWNVATPFCIVLLVYCSVF